MAASKIMAKLKRFCIYHPLKLLIKHSILPIVTGRYANIERHERVCNLCDKQSVGDEYHYIFICPEFNLERLKYLGTKQFRYPNVLAMEKLFNSKNIQTISNL